MKALRRLITCLAIAFASFGTVGAITTPSVSADEYAVSSCSNTYIISYATGYPVAVGSKISGCQPGLHVGDWHYYRAMVACNGSGTWTYSSWVHHLRGYGTSASKYCPSGQTATAKSWQAGKH